MTTSDSAPVYVISVAAQLAGMHPQTLRTYDRMGLLSPSRTGGGGRRYSARDVRVLQEIVRLSQTEGINLEGVRRILALEDQVAALQQRVAELTQDLARAQAEVEHQVARTHASYKRELVPVDTGAVVVWRGRR